MKWIFTHAMHPERADLIEGAIGHLSMFHDSFGYYADGVGPDTATMPNDEMKFATPYYIGNLTVVSPNLHDIAVSKCVAGRDKDAGRVRALLRHRMFSIDRLVERLCQIDASAHPLQPLQPLVGWARRRAAEADA